MYRLYPSDGAKAKSDSDQIETKEIFTKLQEMQKQIGKYVKEQNYLEWFKLRDEYQAICNKALSKMQNFERYGSTQPDIDAAFNNLFRAAEQSDSSPELVFPLDEIEAKLTEIVNSFARTDKLRLTPGGQPPRIKDDKIHEIIGVEKNFKHKSDVLWVLSLKNGMIVSGSSDASIRIWDPKSGKWVKVLEGHTHTVLCIIELESGYLASGSMDQTAIIWNPNNGKIVNILEGFQNPIIGLVEFDQKQLAINFNEPLLLVWSWNNSSKSSLSSSTFPLGTSSLSWVQKHEDFLVWGWEDGMICKIEPGKSTEPTLKYLKHTDVILDIKSVSESMFVSNSTDLSIILWDVATADVLKTVQLWQDICLAMNYEKDLDLLMFAWLDGKIQAVDLSPEIEEVKVKYTLDQASPVYFCAWVGFKEMKFLKKGKNGPSEDIVNQVIKEEVESGKSDRDRKGDSPGSQEEKKEFNVGKVDLGGQKPKINMDLGIGSALPGQKQKVNINGILGINKEVLEDPHIEEMRSQGMCYVIATIDQENSNTLILWDLQGDGADRPTKICEIDTGFESDEVTCMIKGNDDKIYIGGRDGSLKAVRITDASK